MKSQRLFHVISNTHWDREWRFPFQKNRQLLVEMIDKAIEILENNPKYRAFHLDSQSIVIQDYLEIKPQKKNVIKKMVKANRLIIGPWFTLPEEFQVGGEALIRNLLFGHKICHELGGVMKVGYTPFSWGQISQLPQIYREFGIDVVMFYRGINSLDSPKAEFIWEGADGTRLLASRFSTMPRYNFYFYIFRPVIHNEHMFDLEYRWNNGRIPFHWADSTMYQEDFNLLQPPQKLHFKNLRKSVNAIIKDQINDFTTPHIFWAEGHDSSGPTEHTVQVIKKINEFIKEGKVIHSTLPAYAEALKNSADYQLLRLVKGECRSSQFDRRSGNLYGYTISARMYLKQYNFDSERWLQFYAEPFQTIAQILGMVSEDQYLDIAWKLLLQNHAHDSIGGCSLDEVHIDMENRYKQCQEITKGIFDRSIKFLAQKFYRPINQPEKLQLVVVNPYPVFRSDILICYLDVPKEMDQGNIELLDGTGKGIPVQIRSRSFIQPVLEQLINRPLYLNTTRYECFIEAKNIPACGFQTFQIKPVKKRKSVGTPLGKIVNGLPILENSALQIAIQKNGTLNIFNKTHKLQFKKLAFFYDEGESGHAWIHQPVKPIIMSLDSRPIIEICENGPLFCRCRIEHHLAIPIGLTTSGKRSTKKTKMPIILNVLLNKLSRHVELQIELENTSENHRLRLMFPTNLRPTYSFGEGQFDVVARRTSRSNCRDWVEQPMYDYPMHHFVDISDGKKGAAVMVDGLKEYEFLPDKEGTLAITLFRAFTYRIQPSSLQDFSHQKGSQCLGRHTYRLAFYPHLGNWEQASVYQNALKFHLTPKSFIMGGVTPQHPDGPSFLQIDPEDIIFSCFKKAEGNDKHFYILRVYNPNESTREAKISFYTAIRTVTQVTLEEKKIRSIPISDPHSFSFQIDSKKINTFKIRFQ